MGTKPRLLECAVYLGKDFDIERTAFKHEVLGSAMGGRGYLLGLQGLPEGEGQSGLKKREFIFLSGGKENA